MTTTDKKQNECLSAYGAICDFTIPESATGADAAKVLTAAEKAVAAATKKRAALLKLSACTKAIEEARAEAEKHVNALKLQADEISRAEEAARSEREKEEAARKANERAEAIAADVATAMGETLPTNTITAHLTAPRVTFGERAKNNISFKGLLLSCIVDMKSEGEGEAAEVLQVRAIETYKAIATAIGVKIEFTKSLRKIAKQLTIDILKAMKITVNNSPAVLERKKIEGIEYFQTKKLENWQVLDLLAFGEAFAANGKKLKIATSDIVRAKNIAQLELEPAGVDYQALTANFYDANGVALPSAKIEEIVKSLRAEKVRKAQNVIDKY